jgi:hypothetical protein
MLVDSFHLRHRRWLLKNRRSGCVPPRFGSILIEATVFLLKLVDGLINAEAASLFDHHRTGKDSLSQDNAIQ